MILMAAQREPEEPGSDVLNARSRSCPKCPACLSHKFLGPCIVLVTASFAGHPTRTRTHSAAGSLAYIRPRARLLTQPARCPGGAGTGLAWPHQGRSGRQSGKPGVSWCNRWMKQSEGPVEHLGLDGSRKTSAAISRSGGVCRHLRKTNTCGDDDGKNSGGCVDRSSLVQQRLSAILQSRSLRARSLRAELRTLRRESSRQRARLAQRDAKHS